MRKNLAKDGLQVVCQLDSVRAIEEEIQNHAIEGLTLAEIVNKQKDDELNEKPRARMKELAEVVIPGLEKKLEQAKDHQRIEARLREDAKLANSAKSFQEIINNRPALQLPVNGQEPEEANKPDRIYVKTAALRAFPNEREALNGGWFLRAICSRHGDDMYMKAVKYCHSHGLVVTNASTEGSGTTGGYLVPAPLSATLINVRERVGVMRRVANVVPMTSDMQSIPKKTGGLTVYYPGEASTITESNLAFGQISLAAIKRACLTQISQELSDDAIISVADTAFAEMGYALALQEDNEGINGTGASTYGGVRGLLNRLGAGGVSTAATGHDTWPELDLADVMAAQALLPDRYQDGASWICSTNFYIAVFARLLASAGGNTIANVQMGDGGRRDWWGVPVFTTSQMPTATAAATTCALFGNFREAIVLGNRSEVRLARDDSTGFATDVITLRATARYDMNVHEPGTASVAGAYVGLKTAA